MRRREETGALVENETTVAVSGAATKGSYESRSSLREGSVVGRYVVLEQIGRGGMGMVLRAYDPKLRREVALKVVRSGSGVGGGEAEVRMIREAQALPPLRSPHVVSVYDAEVTAYGVCIAMEYVEGRTLRRWLKEAKRPWSEVLEVMSAAGRGLAAAHAAGVVHRDVKPDNVLVGDDGRVLLTDFGLAREAEGSPSSAPSWPVVGASGEVAAWSGEDASSDPRSGDRPAPSPRVEESREFDSGATMTGSTGLADLTRVGTVMGTPSYMAPEQDTGRRADARSDQYALCVTLWEALHGERPFHGGGLEALAKERQTGPPARPHDDVPQWVHAAVARGLAVEPDERWPSVEALMEALASGQVRQRRRRTLGGVLLVGAMAAGALGWQHWNAVVRTTACEREGERIEEVWNEETRERLRAALLGTKTSHAEVTVDKVMPWLDAYADTWTMASTEACLDARVRGVWDDDVHERSRWCLDERQMELEALLVELSRADPEIVNQAVPAAAGLGSVEPCRDRELLSRTPVPPPERREDVRAVRAQLFRVSALQRTVAYAEGVRVARDALERAQALDWPPLVAVAQLRLGKLLVLAGAPAEAEKVLEAGYFEAANAGATEVAAALADALVFAVGSRLRRHEDGLRWSRFAEVALSSFPDVTGIRTASHLNRLGGIHYAMGSYEEAKRLYERSLVLLEKALGPEHPGSAQGLEDIALVDFSLASYDEAMRAYERALAIKEEAFGPDHPTIAYTLNAIANVHWSLKSYDEALPLYERALAIREQALGPEHVDTAQCLNNIATIHLMTGAYAEAKRLFGRTLAIEEKALGPDHPEVALSLTNLAAAHREMGAYDEAKMLHERARTILENALGPEHPQLGLVLVSLGETHQKMGSFADAKRQYERAMAIAEKALGPEHPSVAAVLVKLAQVELLQQRAAAAVPLAERAVQISQAGDAPAVDLAGARFVLARAVHEAGGDREHALRVAEKVREFYVASDRHASELAEVEAWLKARRRGQ
jgi:eukaryotic-like serine/threonine-protein kinase